MEFSPAPTATFIEECLPHPWSERANEGALRSSNRGVQAPKEPQRSFGTHTRPPRPARDKNTANGTRQCGLARCKTCAMVKDIQEIEFADQPGRKEVIRASSHARQLM